MKFQLKFNKDVYNQQMDVLFDLAWKRKKEYYRNSQYFGFILLIIGCALIFNRPSFFNFAFIVFGLSILVPYFYYYFKIKSVCKKLETEKAIQIETANNQNTMLWEFTETCLIMKSEESEKKLNWEEFIAHLAKENNLLMFTKSYEPYILSETEVGKENFKMIVDFVNAKISH